MNLRYYLQVAAWTLTLSASLGACDHIAEEDRWTRVDLPVLPADQRTTVLVEEYTGQKCINCPGAAAELARIAKTDSKHILTVALHAESTGQTQPELACAEANEYAHLFGIPRSVPGILINRQPQGSNHYLQDKSAWNSLIHRAVHTPARCRLHLQAQAQPDGSYRVSVRSQALDTRLNQRSIALQLWAVEDIRAEQLLPTGPKSDYFHHHVLRGALNGAAGTPHRLGQEEQRSVRLPANVKVADNAQIIAFLYDTATQEVYEAALVALGEGIQPDVEQPGGGEDGKDEPQSGDLTLYCGEQVVASGSEVVAQDIRTHQTPQGKEVEVVSPLLYVQSGKEATYTFELVKEDHAGSEYGGLGQICVAGKCMDSPSTERFEQTPFKPVRSEFIQVHYRIGAAYQHEKRDYRVKLAIKHQGTELQTLTLKFSYNPDGTGPKPEPEPHPEPTPPTPPAPPVVPEDPALSNLLVMDFTGQRCGYCIYTIKSLAYQESKYPHNLVVVAIHPGHYNEDSNLIFDGWQPYAANVGLGALPTVSYNNEFEDSNIRFYVGELISKAPRYRSQLTGKLNARSVDLTFQSEVADPAMNGKPVNVLFWITESGIKGYQSGEGPDFIHNHIMRGSLNGVWGQTYTPGSKVSLQATLPAKTLVPENCHLVAILVDPTTHYFLDAVQIPLK